MALRVRVASLLFLAILAQPAGAGLLDEYVQRPDPNYKWSMYERSSGILAKYYFLQLQSGQWLNEQLVDRPVWTHEIRVAQPRAAFCGEMAKKTNVAVLVISGGHNRENKTTSVPPQTGLIARAFCRPVIELRQVPNEPLRFADEEIARKEDAIIAYSFNRYLEGDSGDWPVQLAMTRAVVQAMTAIQEFSRTRRDIPDIDHFVLIGASKRGWTAWLSAAVDSRVKAVVPVSIDIGDLDRQFEHHFASYGGYAPALRDYKAFDIACRIASERGAELLKVIDPIAYRDRLTLPKLILNSAGDQFFVSDSWRFYYDQLLGPKQLRYTVNSDHGHGNIIVRLKLFMQVRNWVNDVLAGREPPRLHWERQPDGTLIVKTNREPREMKLWVADNPEARDFRLETLGPEWEARELEPGPDGVYRVRLDEPSQGWRAAVVEGVFGGFTSWSQQVYTTGVYVMPDTLPYGEKEPCGAKQNIVQAEADTAGAGRRSTLDAATPEAGAKAAAGTGLNH